MKLWSDAYQKMIFFGQHEHTIELLTHFNFMPVLTLPIIPVLFLLLHLNFHVFCAFIANKWLTFEDEKFLLASWWLDYDYSSIGLEITTMMNSYFILMNFFRVLFSGEKLAMYWSPLFYVHYLVSHVAYIFLITKLYE